MNVTPFVVGCDISKSKIDFFNAGTSQHNVVPNDAASLQRFLEGFTNHPVRVAFEATGFYGHALRQTLAKNSLSGVQINPLHGRRFAQSTGRLAKTDRIDAAQLAKMTERLDLPATSAWDDDVENLKSLVIRRDQLVKQHSAESKRKKQTACEVVKTSIERTIAVLDEEIQLFDDLIKNAIAESNELREKNALLRTTPGIGPVTSSVLLAFLPEAGTISRSAIASLAGVAPMAHDSGQFTGKRSIAGGRKIVRRALYMAASGCMTGKSEFTRKYQELKQKGKPSKVAMIAVARKILITANALLKTKTPYNPA